MNIEKIIDKEVIMKRFTLTALALIAVLLMTAPLFAQNGQGKGNCDGTGPGMNNGMMKGEGMGPGMPMMVPDLTTDQIKKMDDLRYEHQKAMIDLRAKKETKQLELMNMFRKDPSEKKIFSAIDDLEKIKTQMLKERVKNHLAMRNLLTDKQKEVFDMMGFRMKEGHGNEGPKMNMMKKVMIDKNCADCENGR